jgi:hypothetical protein
MIAATVMYPNAPTPSRITAVRATVAAIAASTMRKISGRSCTTALTMRFRQSFRQALQVDDRDRQNGVTLSLRGLGSGCEQFSAKVDHGLLDHDATGRRF